MASLSETGFESRRDSTTWLGVEPEEADAAGESIGLLLEIIEQLLPRPHDDVLDGIAQGRFQQRSRLHACSQQIGQQPADLAPRAARCGACQREHLFDAGAQTLVAFLQLLQHRDPAGRSTGTLLQLCQFRMPAVPLLAVIGQPGRAALSCSLR